MFSKIFKLVSILILVCSISIVFGEMLPFEVSTTLDFYHNNMKESQKAEMDNFVKTFGYDSFDKFLGDPEVYGSVNLEVSSTGGQGLASHHLAIENLVLKGNNYGKVETSIVLYSPTSSLLDLSINDLNVRVSNEGELRKTISDSGSQPIDEIIDSVNWNEAVITDTAIALVSTEKTDPIEIEKKSSSSVLSDDEAVVEVKETEEYTDPYDELLYSVEELEYLIEVHGEDISDERYEEIYDMILYFDEEINPNSDFNLEERISDKSLEEFREIYLEMQYSTEAEIKLNELKRNLGNKKEYLESEEILELEKEIELYENLYSQLGNGKSISLKDNGFYDGKTLTEDEIAYYESLDPLEKMNLILSNKGISIETKIKKSPSLYAFATLKALLNPDADSLAAAKFFGFEKDYSKVPRFFTDSLGASICLAKIDGYLDEREEDGGVTNYISLNTSEEIVVLDDLRAQRTPRTPDGKTAITYSYFLRAPSDVGVKYSIVITYVDQGETRGEAIFEKLQNLSEGEIQSGFDTVFFPLNGSITEDANNFNINLIVLDSSENLLRKRTVPVILISEGDIFEAQVKEVQEQASSESAATEGETSTPGVTNDDLVDIATGG